MNENTDTLPPETCEILESLRQCPRVPAPTTLLSTVLLRTGTGDAYASAETPIGPVFVAYNQRGISALTRADEPEQFEVGFRKRFGRPICRVTALPESFATAVAAQLSGERSWAPEFDLRNATAFERSVLLKALEIPRGEVRPYSWIAKEIGRPGAVRAVGTALGHNPVPLLIPCHRVVRSDGAIGDYLLGSDTKRAVLDSEGAAPDIIERLGRQGVRYIANPESHTFCLPTCGGDHRRIDYTQRGLHSEREALAAGLRPCQDCRPATAIA